MSGWSLNFDERFDYPHDKQGINLSLKISKESMLPVSVQAKLDTGSTFCIFQTHYAQMLGLELEKGDVELVRTATGKFIAHGHEVTPTAEIWNGKQPFISPPTNFFRSTSSAESVF